MSHAATLGLFNLPSNYNLGFNQITSTLTPNCFIYENFRLVHANKFLYLVLRAEAWNQDKGVEARRKPY